MLEMSLRHCVWPKSFPSCATSLRRRTPARNSSQSIHEREGLARSINWPSCVLGQANRPSSRAAVRACFKTSNARRSGRLYTTTVNACDVIPLVANVTVTRVCMRSLIRTTPSHSERTSGSAVRRSSLCRGCLTVLLSGRSERMRASGPLQLDVRQRIPNHRRPGAHLAMHHELSRRAGKRRPSRGECCPVSAPFGAPAGQSQEPLPAATPAERSSTCTSARQPVPLRPPLPGACSPDRRSARAAPLHGCRSADPLLPRTVAGPQGRFVCLTHGSAARSGASAATGS